MSLFQDLRYACRNLTRTPVFLTVAILSLALGIGANTAIFGLIYSVLYRTLPVKNPQSLVLFNDPAAEGMQVGGSNGEQTYVTWPEFQDLHRVRALDGLFAVMTPLFKMTIRLGRNEEEARAKMVSGAYFSVLGLRPQAGRLFDESMDGIPGGAPFVVLSDEYWARRFGRDSTIIGKPLVLKKTVFSIIGVAPRGFSGERVGQMPDFWVPVSMQMQFAPGMDFLHPMPNPTQKIMWLDVFGRLSGGATLQQAQSQTDTVFRESLEQSYQSLSPATRKELLENQRLKLRPASIGTSSMRDSFSQSMFVVFAALGATLLICCANLSNLLLARSNDRQHEITLRLALGATRSRVARYLFAEGLILSLAGGVLGLLLSDTISPLLLRMASTPGRPIDLNTDIDWRVLLFTGAVAVATTVLCSLAPSVKATQVRLMETLRQGGHGLTLSRNKLLVGRLFVVGQVALSLLLLVSAGLLLRTLVNLKSVDLGYDPHRLAMISVDATAAAANGQTRRSVLHNALEKLRLTPGVQGVTISESGLFGGNETGGPISVEGYTLASKDDQFTRFDMVGPDYFSSLGIPLLQGREIREGDSSPVCVINDAFRKQYFAGRNAIGKHLLTQDIKGDISYEVVGVARNSRDHSLRDKVLPRVFVPFFQMNFKPEVLRFGTYEVRVAAATGETLRALKKVVSGVNPDLDVNPRLLSEHLDDQTASERLLANLITLFGVLALGLATIGVYGVLSYNVSQRVREIGLRMAIGARAKDVAMMIARETVLMISGGLVLGLALSQVAAQLIKSKLFNVASGDPVVMVSTVVILGMIGLLAAVLPALRATRVDPVIALHSE